MMELCDANYVFMSLNATTFAYGAADGKDTEEQGNKRTLGPAQGAERVLGSHLLIFGTPLSGSSGAVLCCHMLMMMHMAMLTQAKLAKLRRELLDPQSAAGGGGGGGRGEGFDVNKVGDARIGLVGGSMAEEALACHSIGHR